MKPLAPLLLPAAATALAVTTLSTSLGTTTLAAERSSPPRTAPTAVSSPAVGSRSVPGGPPRVASSAGAGRPATARATPRRRWAWPLAPRPAVARPFVRPTSTWGAGHRGVDLLTTTDAGVHAVDDGVVTHVGVVAGRGTVTVLHRSGLRSTYEPVVAGVVVGDEVRRGDLIGTVAAGGHCAPAACLHLGALRADTYLDPLALLSGARVRLLPLR